MCCLKCSLRGAAGDGDGAWAICFTILAIADINSWPRRYEAAATQEAAPAAAPDAQAAAHQKGAATAAATKSASVSSLSSVSSRPSGMCVFRPGRRACRLAATCKHCLFVDGVSQQLLRYRPMQSYQTPAPSQSCSRVRSAGQPLLTKGQCSWACPQRPWILPTQMSHVTVLTAVLLCCQVGKIMGPKAESLNWCEWNPATCHVHTGSYCKGDGDFFCCPTFSCIADTNNPEIDYCCAPHTLHWMPDAHYNTAGKSRPVIAAREALHSLRRFCYQQRDTLERIMS